MAAPPSDAQCQNYFADARSKKRREGDGQQNPRERKKCVDEQKIHKAIEPSACVARQHSDDEAGKPASKHNGNRDKQLNARAIKGACESAAAQFVAAEPVGSG